MNIYVFDIDGCILDSVFPEAFYKDKEEKGNIINIVMEKAENIRLYSEFIEFFYKNIYNSRDFTVFVTGRQALPFQDITIRQLEPILLWRQVLLKFFPDDLDHSPDIYFQWKISIMGDLFKMYSSKITDPLIFYIFDDHPDYFENIKEISKSFINIEVKCFHIFEAKHWREVEL